MVSNGIERLLMMLFSVRGRVSHLFAVPVLLFCLTSCSIVDQASIITDSIAGRAFSCCPLFSPDGRYLSFGSGSSNLVPNDTNNDFDGFVFDIAAGQLTLNSSGFDGSQSNDGSGRPAMSSGGRFAAFSAASNLSPDDVDETTDPFLQDRETGKTIRIPDAKQLSGFSPLSASGISMSSDGQWIAFRRGFRAPELKNDYQVFVFDRIVGETHAVSLTTEGEFPNAWAADPEISPDGRYVAFTSDATDLTQDADTGHENVFLHELPSGKTACITCTPDAPRLDYGNHGGPTFSGDSRFLAYPSYQYGWITMFDLEQSSFLSPLDLGCNCGPATSTPALSHDGTLIVFDARVDRPPTSFESWFRTLCTECGTSASQTVIFIHDRTTGTTTRVFPIEELTPRSDVDARNPTISPDGRYVAFDNLVRHRTKNSPGIRDIIIFDRETGKSMVVTAGNGKFQWSE